MLATFYVLFLVAIVTAIGFYLLAEDRLDSLRTLQKTLDVYQSRTASELLAAAEVLDPFIAKGSCSRLTGFNFQSGEDIVPLKIVLPPSLSDTRRSGDAITFQQPGPPLLFTLEGQLIPNVAGVVLDFDQRFACVRGVYWQQDRRDFTDGRKNKDIPRQPFHAARVEVVEDWARWTNLCATASRDPVRVANAAPIGLRQMIEKARPTRGLLLGTVS